LYNSIKEVNSNLEEINWDKAWNFYV
jgi:hypothetical protein